MRSQLLDLISPIIRIVLDLLRPAGDGAEGIACAHGLEVDEERAFRGKPGEYGDGNGGLIPVLGARKVQLALDEVLVDGIPESCGDFGRVRLGLVH